MQNLTVEAILLVLLLLLTVAVIFTRDLIACVILFSIFSFIAVLTYFVFGSPDVAFTEAVIGVMSTVFFVIALRKIGRWTKS